MSQEFFHRGEVFIGQLQQVECRAQEVVKMLDDRPHLLVRLDITGPHFPHRAAEPFVRILSRERVVAKSWFTRISEDSRKLMAYFPVDVPAGDTIEFGYAVNVMGRIAASFDAKAVKHLERERLPKETVEVSNEYLSGKP